MRSRDLNSLFLIDITNYKYSIELTVVQDTCGYYGDAYTKDCYLPFDWLANTCFITDSFFTFV